MEGKTVTKGLICCILGCVLLLGFSSHANAADWRFPLGFTYASGFNDIVDIYENNLAKKGYIADTQYVWPIGIAFRPYFESESGLGFGTDIGPVMIVSTTGGYEDYSFFNLPLNLNMRYTPFPKSDASPYIRGGASYNLASGDFVDKSKAGLFGAFGLEFNRTKSIGFGFEIAYDTSEIEMREYKTSSKYSSKAIKPGGFMASFFMVF
jgi:hypothetical protein